MTSLVQALELWQREGKTVNIATCGGKLWVLVYTDDGEPHQVQPKDAQDLVIRVDNLLHDKILKDCRHSSLVL